MIVKEPELDRKAYGRLLQRTYPGVIKNDAENERLLVIIEGLMAKGDGELTPEEDALLELLLRLVHDYERERYPIPPSPPHEVVSYLMEQRGLRPKDLVPVLGTKGRVSEVLSGTRGISKEQAKALAGFFGVDVGLFI